MQDFKEVSELGGAPNFGQFVAGGAQLHLGSIGPCLP